MSQPVQTSRFLTPQILRAFCSFGGSSKATQCDRSAAAASAPAVSFDGEALAVRLLQPRDALDFQAFVRRLSRQSRRGRFWSTFDELPASLLSALTETKVSQIALVAEVGSPRGIVGEARYVGDENGKDAEVAVVVADEWQRRGVARQLMEVLQSTARSDGYDRLYCYIQAENDAMRALTRSCGYRPAGAVGEAGVRRFECLLHSRTI